MTTETANAVIGLVIENLNEWPDAAIDETRRFDNRVAEDDERARWNEQTASLHAAVWDRYADERETFERSVA